MGIVFDSWLTGRFCDVGVVFGDVFNVVAVVGGPEHLLPVVVWDGRIDELLLLVRLLAGVEQQTLDPRVDGLPEDGVEELAHGRRRRRRRRSDVASVRRLARRWRRCWRRKNNFAVFKIRVFIERHRRDAGKRRNDDDERRDQKII